MPSNHLILCRPLLLLCSIFPSIWVFSNESALLIWWPKYWSFSFSTSPFNEYSGLISFRLTGFISLLSKGLLKVFSSAIFTNINSLVLSLLYGPALISIHDYWKNHSFHYITFVSKVMSLLFNMLSRFVIAFLPSGKHLLISWLQSPSVLYFGDQENKIYHFFHFFNPSICPELMGPHAKILVFFHVEFKVSFFTLIKSLFSSSSLSSI